MFDAADEKIHGVVADGNYLIRAGLQALFSSNSPKIRFHEATDEPMIFDLLSQHQCSLALIDPTLCGERCEIVIREIRRQSPGTLVLAFSQTATEEDVYRMAKSGARGFLLKSAERDEILLAVSAILQGQRWMPPPIMRLYASRLSRKQITEREMEILQLLGLGMDNQMIAEQLCIARNTVKNHIANLFAKLEANDRLQAIANAMGRGLILHNPDLVQTAAIPSLEDTGEQIS